MASLNELGLGGVIHPYTGIGSIDWILNHHMTPLFTLFVATAIFRYGYTAGYFFPLDESEKLKQTSTTTTNATNSNDTTVKKKKEKGHEKNRTKKKKPDHFVLGILCQPSKDLDRLKKQRSAVTTMKKVKGVRVVMDADPMNEELDAVYISYDNSDRQMEQIKLSLKLKKHVLVDFPLSNNIKVLDVSLLQAIAKNSGVLLIQLVPTRYVASWERLFSSVHAEAGQVSVVHMEYSTGTLPRCIEKLFNCCCRCSWINSCRGRGSSKRARSSASPTLKDATTEGLSLLHELLSDIALDNQPLTILENNSLQNKYVNISGKYSMKKKTKKKEKNEKNEKNDNQSKSKEIEFETEWNYKCNTNSWSFNFPKATIHIEGSESNILYQWYDSIDGNQTIQVQSKYGFSHTDHVSDLYDSWTMSIVAFVRAIKHKDDIKDMLLSTEAALVCSKSFDI